MGHVRINLEDNLHKNLKRRAIDEGIPMREVLVKALQEYIEQHFPLPSMDQGPEKPQNRSRGNVQMRAQIQRW